MVYLKILIFRTYYFGEGLGTMNNHEELLGCIKAIGNKRGKEVELYTQICNLCDTGLDKRMVMVIIELLENNVDPNSIVDMINEMRKIKQVV